MALYHRYRSQQLGELAGQSHIVQILGNAITSQRVGHAYLFSGPRGTGKTSTARILATSLNCDQGMTVTPCGRCHNCVAITHGHSSDVVEMDAASHTGVDHIRGIIEQVIFQPIECRYRMYIIDEVHMLSGGAFNALLKTLEEPPAHVMFILATTEPHKVPSTIHSRCQHLQFRRLTHEELVAQLDYIVRQESLTVDDGVLDVVARRAGGSMRDAISVLEQLVAYSGSHMSLSDVQGILGVSDPAVVKSVVSAILAGDVKGVLAHLREGELSGIHPVQWADDMIQWLTTCLLTGFESNEGSLCLPDGGTIQSVSQLLDVLSQLLLDFRQYPDPYTVFRVRLLSFIAGGQASQARGGGVLVSETLPSSVTASASVAPVPMSPSGSVRLASSGLVSDGVVGESAQASALAALNAARGEGVPVVPVGLGGSGGPVPGVPVPGMATPAQVEGLAKVKAARGEGVPVGPAGSGGPVPGVPVPGMGTPDEASALAAPNAARSEGVPGVPVGLAGSGGPVPGVPVPGMGTPAQASALAAPNAARGEGVPVVPVGSGEGGGHWARVLQLVQTDSQPMYSILMGSRAMEEGGGVLAIQLRQTFSFFIEKLNEPTNRQILSTAIQQVYGPAHSFYVVGDSQEGTDRVAGGTGSATMDGRSHKLNEIIALFDGVKMD